MTDREFDVCIVGAGAVGLLFAVLLSANKRVALLTKKERAVELTGLRPRVVGHLERSAGDLSIVGDARGLSARAYCLCVKAHSLPDAVTAIESAARRDGSSIVCASNGFGIHEELTALLPGAPLVRLLCGFGASLVNGHESKLAGPMSAVCSSAPAYAGVRAQIALLFGSIGCDCSEEGDPRRSEWRKALVNVPVNTICSILDTENGAILEDPRLRVTAERMIGEVLAAAEMDGRSLTISPGAVIESVRAHAANINSTLADIRARKATESEAIVGRVLSAASVLGADMSVTSALYSLLLARERLAGCRAD